MDNTSREEIPRPYNLSVPPMSDNGQDVANLIIQLDHFALQDEGFIRAQVGGISVEDTSYLLGNLTRVQAEHKARAINIESTIDIIRDELHSRGSYGVNDSFVVGSAAHTMRLDDRPTAPPSSETVSPTASGRG